jgi:hypothetical protein
MSNVNEHYENLLEEAKRIVKRDKGTNPAIRGLRVHLIENPSGLYDLALIAELKYKTETHLVTGEPVKVSIERETHLNDLLDTAKEVVKQLETLDKNIKVELFFD